MTRRRAAPWVAALAVTLVPVGAIVAGQVLSRYTSPPWSPTTVQVGIPSPGPATPTDRPQRLPTELPRPTGAPEPGQ